MQAVVRQELVVEITARQAQGLQLLGETSCLGTLWRVGVVRGVGRLVGSVILPGSLIPRTMCYQLKSLRLK